jgi:heavy metal sensor kinase
MRLRPRHVRARLTLLYVLVLAVVLALYAGGTSVLLLLDLRGELKRHAVQDLETVEGLLSFDANGKIVFRDDYHNHPESKLIQERYLEVLTADGQKVLFRNDRLAGRELGGPAFVGEGEGGYSERVARLSDGSRILLISRRHSINGKVILMRLAYSEEPLWTQYWELLGALILGFPIALGIAGLAGYLLARRVLRPLEQMTARAEGITPEHLNERLPIENPDDELGQLARVFNVTLDRLEKSFERLKRFTADASHELRTPLASIRGVGEVVLLRGGTPEDYRDAIGSMLEESSRLTRLVDNLLAISRSDAGQLQLQSAPIPVLDAMREAASLLDVLLEEKSQSIRIQGDEDAVVQGDRLILRQAFVNVLHNAVKYSPKGGGIVIEASNGIHVAVSVTDSGPGIPEEHRERVFDRFYRVDPSRSREAGGAGLGLSIAKWAVEAHGGSIKLDRRVRAPGGATFCMEFPRQARSIVWPQEDPSPPSVTTDALETWEKM